MRRVIGVSVSLVLAASLCSSAEERPDEAMFWKIRQEATSRSQILQTLHVLTDVYGPRLTGSPNLKAAGEWAVQQMTSWGLKNGHLEPWEFGYSGMGERARSTAHIISPVKDALVGRSAGLDAGHDWRRARSGGADHAAGAADAGRSDLVPRDHQVHDQGQDRPRRTAPAGAGDVQPGAASPRRRRRVHLLNTPPAQTARSGCRRLSRRATPPGPASADQRADPGAAESVPDRQRRARAHQRRRPRPRTDSRLRQRHPRHHEGAADGRDAQRRLRPHLAPARRQAAGRARVRDRQPQLSRGPHQLQHRSPRSRAPTRPTKWSCSAVISTRGTRRPARPTTPSAAR